MSSEYKVLSVRYSDKHVMAYVLMEGTHSTKNTDRSTKGETKYGLKFIQVTQTVNLRNSEVRALCIRFVENIF